MIGTLVVSLLVTRTDSVDLRANLLIKPVTPVTENSLPDMFGGVDGPISGISDQHYAFFTGWGTDSDTYGTVFRNNHEGYGNDTTYDSDAPGYLVSKTLLQSNPNTGYKKWEFVYILINVPDELTYIKTFKMDLLDLEEDEDYLDADEVYSKTISISGPASGGGPGL